MVMHIDSSADPDVRPGSRVGIRVPDASAAGLADARKGSERQIRVVYFDRGPTVLRVVPPGGSKYDASNDSRAPFMKLYSDPNYAWDPRPAKTVTGDIRWPVREDIAGRDVYFLTISSRDGAAHFFTIPVDQPRTLVHLRNVEESVASDAGRAILWNNASQLADQAVTQPNQPARSVTATLNANGECLEIRFP